MKGSELARLTEINMLSEAVNNVTDITFTDDTQKTAFLERAKNKLQQLLSEFVGN